VIVLFEYFVLNRYSTFFSVKITQFMRENQMNK